jgi:Ca2+-binding EF-hand superfamily protein
MGEPFWPTTREDSGLAAWVRAADSNHDGQLTLEEMKGDADRFFALLDVDGDGEIGPDEIARYETVVAPHISSALEQGGAHLDLLGLPEPVTAADSNFNRGVSREEFRQAAAKRFVALDLDHHGYLTLAGVQSIRPARPARANRQVTAEEPRRDDDATSYRPHQ